MNSIYLNLFSLLFIFIYFELCSCVIFLQINNSLPAALILDLQHLYITVPFGVNNVIPYTEIYSNAVRGPYRYNTKGMEMTPQIGRAHV